MGEVRSGCAVRAAIQDELAAKHEALQEDSVSVVMRFALAIQHGDEEHRAWLREAARAFLRGAAIPPARDANGPITQQRGAGEPIAIRDIPHWNKVGAGTPLGCKLETMHQDEYVPASVDDGMNPFTRTEERGVMLCTARILVVGDGIEWIDSHGYSTLVNPGSFRAPTHWRWQHGSGGI